MGFSLKKTKKSKFWKFQNSRPKKGVFWWFWPLGMWNSHFWLHQWIPHVNFTLDTKNFGCVYNVKGVNFNSKKPKMVIFWFKSLLLALLPYKLIKLPRIGLQCKITWTRIRRIKKNKRSDSLGKHLGPSKS